MAVTVQPGQTVREVKETQILNPPAPGTKDPALPTQSKFMEWIRDLPESEWEKREIAVRLYRGTDTKFFLAKVFKPPFNEEWIQKTYGGGEYHILGFEGPQLRWNFDIEIFGRAKEPNEVEVQQQPMGNDALAVMREMVTMLRDELRAARGGDVATEAVRQAVALNGEVFRGAVSSVQGVLHPGGAPGKTKSEELMDQFMAAMIAKMMNPADPIEQFSKMLTAMTALGVGPGAPGGGNMVSDAIRALPAVMTGLSNITANMARAKEIELNGFLEARRAGIPVGPPQAAPAPPPPPPPVPTRAETQPPPAAPNPNGALLQPRDGFELIETGVVNNLIDPNRPVDEAADQVLIYLDSIMPDWVDQMIAQGEDALLKLFRERRILQQIPQNPRLAEFVKKFLELARESRQQFQPPAPAAD